MRFSPRRGFTLIELLTVIAIIGILAAVLIPAALAVQKRAKVANSQSAMSSWASGVVRYRQAYGFYPVIVTPTATLAYPTTDITYRLEGGTTTSNLGSVFIMAVSGRNANGTPLASTSLSSNRARYNRNAEAFVDFSRDDFEDFTKFPTTQTNDLGTGNFLVDRLGNRNIRVAIDFTGDGFLRSATGFPTPAAAIPLSIRNFSTTTGIPGRVLIYTSKTDVTSLDDPVAAPGTERPDYADVIALQ